MTEPQHGRVTGFVSGCSCRVCYNWAYRRGYRANNPTNKWAAKLEEEIRLVEADITRVLKLGRDDRGVSLASTVIDPSLQTNHPMFLTVKAGPNRVNRYALSRHENGTSTYVFLGSEEPT